jgi:hypothetical protein
MCCSSQDPIFITLYIILSQTDVNARIPAPCGRLLLAQLKILPELWFMRTRRMTIIHDKDNALPIHDILGLLNVPDPLSYSVQALQLFPFVYSLIWKSERSSRNFMALSSFQVDQQDLQQCLYLKFVCPVRIF